MWAADFDQLRQVVARSARARSVITEPIEIACRRRCRASSTPVADGITSSEWHALSLVATLVSEVEGSDVQLRDKLVELARFDPYHQVFLRTPQHICPATM